MRIYRVYTSRNFSHATSMEIHQSQKKKKKKKRRKYGKNFYSYNPDVSNVEQKYLKNYRDIW